MDYNQIVREYYDEAISKLKEWIQIDSVYDQQTVTVEHPFGEGVHQALEFIASLAEEPPVTYSIKPPTLIYNLSSAALARVRTT